MSLPTAPSEPGSVLWEGQLSPLADIEAEDSKSIFSRRLDLEDLGSDLPTVSIGHPQVLKAVSTADVPGFEHVEPEDAYLIRLWCSFRDNGTDLRFDRAVFSLSLSSPSDPDARVTARDMHPAEVIDKVKRDVQVALAPEVKFSEVSVNLGSVSYGFSYEELQPVILAAGQGESTPAWTLASTRARRLQGGKVMHLLAACPSGTTRGAARLDLTAYVTKPGLLPLPMGLFARRGPVSAPGVEAELW